MGTESSLEIAWGRRGVHGDSDHQWVRDFLLRREKVLKLIMVMVTQLCKYTENHQIVHFKWTNFMAYGLYPNKAAE